MKLDDRAWIVEIRIGTTQEWIAMRDGHPLFLEDALNVVRTERADDHDLDLILHYVYRVRHQWSGTVVFP